MSEIDLLNRTTKPLKHRIDIPRNSVPTQFNLDLSNIDTKIKKLIKFLENGIIINDLIDIKFNHFYDFKALKSDLENRKYKENISNAITKSYAFAIEPKRRELFELPPDEWRDLDSVKMLLNLFTGPRDADGNIFGSFEAVNTNPNNLLLELFNIKPYKYLKISFLDRKEVEKYYLLAGNKIKADKYATILAACTRTTNDDIKNNVSYFDHKFNIFSKFLKPEYFRDGKEEESLYKKIDDFAEGLKAAVNSKLYEFLSSSEEILSAAKETDSEFLNILKDRSYGGFDLTNAPDFASNDYDIFKIKLLSYFIFLNLQSIMSNAKAAADALYSFEPSNQYYDFVRQCFIDSRGNPIMETIPPPNGQGESIQKQKKELYIKFTYFKDVPDNISRKYQKKLPKQLIEFKKYPEGVVSTLDTLTRMVDEEYTAILSAEDTNLSPTVYSILSDIDFIAGCIEEGPKFICPPATATMEELQEASKTDLDDIIRGYLEPDPNGLHKISIKEEIDEKTRNEKVKKKIPFFDYSNFPEHYFIPFEGYGVVSGELTENKRDLLINNKFYYTSPDKQPISDIMMNEVYKRMFGNIINKNGFAGFFPPPDSFMKDQKQIKEMINKILSDAEKSAREALVTIQKTVMARTNIVCLIQEVITCLFPQGLNCKEILRNFRLSDVDKILKTFFPETIYKDLYVALNDLLKQQMSEEQRKLKEEIESLEKDILNNPRSVIIYRLLNSGTEVDLVRDSADDEEKRLASDPNAEKDRIEILAEKKKMYEDLYLQVKDETTQTTQTVAEMEKAAKLMDQFLDKVEEYVDIEILCDLARLAELLDISLSFNFNWPRFELPSFYLDFSFQIEDVTLDLLIQTIIQLIIGLLEELLTCNGISNLVAAAITGNSSSDGILANVAAAANQMARGKFDIEEFAKTSPAIKNFNVAMDNLAKNVDNMFKVKAGTSISINEPLLGSLTTDSRSSIDARFTKPSEIRSETNANAIVSLSGLSSSDVYKTFSRLPSDIDKSFNQSKENESKKYDSPKTRLNTVRNALVIGQKETKSENGKSIFNNGDGYSSVLKGYGSKYNTDSLKQAKASAKTQLVEKARSNSNQINTNQSTKKVSKSQFKFESTKKMIHMRDDIIALKNTLDIKKKLKNYTDLDPDKKLKSFSQSYSNNNTLNEKKIKNNLINLINEVSLLLEPDELVNLLGGSGSEKTFRLIKTFIDEKSPELSIISDTQIIKNLFSYMASMTGLDKLKNDIINASRIKNRKQQYARRTFCTPESLSEHDLAEQVIADKMTGNDAEKSARKRIDDRKRARDKFSSIAADILNADSSRVKKLMDDAIFKPIVAGKMPEGKSIPLLDEDKKRRIDFAMDSINKDFKTATNSFYSRLSYTTSEKVTINEFINKQGDEIPDSEETIKKEERKPEPEFKFYESHGVQTAGSSDDTYGKSLEVTKMKIINCGAFTQNFDSIANKTRVKIVTSENDEAGEKSQINYGSIEIDMAGSVGERQDIPNTQIFNNIANNKTWNISYKESNIGRAFIAITASRGLEINYKNTLSSEDVNVSSFSKYVDMTLGVMEQALVNNNYDKSTAVRYLKDSYENFIKQIMSSLSNKIVEDSLLKQCSEPSSEILKSLIEGQDLPDSVKNAISSPNPIKTQIVVDTPLKYINFCPKPTKSQISKNKDPGLYGKEEIKVFVNQSLERRTEEFLEKNRMLTSEELYEKKLKENLEELAMFDGYFISLIRVFCADILLKSLFVNRVFNFDKKVLENLLLSSYCSKQILNLVEDFAKDINLKSLIEGMNEQIDNLYSVYYPDDKEDKFSKDIKALKKSYLKIESDRNVLKRYQNDKVNKDVISTEDMKTLLEKEIKCAEDELETIRKELNFLQLRNICKKELEIMFEKLSYIVKADCPDSDRTSEQVLYDIISSSDALMSNIQGELRTKKAEHEENKQLEEVAYQAKRLAEEKATDEIEKKKEEIEKLQSDMILAIEQIKIDKAIEIVNKIVNEYIYLDEIKADFTQAIKDVDLVKIGQILMNIFNTDEDSDKPVFRTIVGYNHFKKQYEREFLENGEAEAAVNAEKLKRKNELLYIESKGMLDVVTLCDASKMVTDSDIDETIENCGGEEKYLETISRKISKNHMFEKYVRVPKIKSDSYLNVIREYQEKHSLHGIINYQNFIGLLKKIKSFPNLKMKKMFEIFEADIKLGVRIVNILDYDNTYEVEIEEDRRNAEGIIKAIRQFSRNNKFKMYFGASSLDDIQVKKDKYLYEKSYAIPQYKDGILKIVNCVPIIHKESVLIDRNTVLNSIIYASGNSALDIFIQQNIENNVKLKEEISCDELNDVLMILSNQGLAVGLLSIASCEMLNDNIAVSMFNAVKFKVMQKYLTSWKIANGESIFDISDFFNQPWISDLLSSFLNIEIILKACVYVLQFYCRLTDPNIPIALAIRDTIKSGVNISAGPFSGKLKPPENIPLPVAPFSLALLPMTVFPPPPVGPGIGPPLTIPGMIYLGADIILLLFDLLKNLDFGSENRHFKNFLQPYCISLSRYKKYGNE